MADSGTRPTKGLPHNWETERAVLGGLLLDSSQAADIQAIVRAEDFSRPSHAGLYALMIAIVGRAGRCDLVAVLDELESRSDFETYGGASYVLALPQACPTVDHLEAHARRVRELADRRRLLLALHRLVETAQDPPLTESGSATTADLCDQATAAIQVVRDGASRDVSWTALPPVVDAVAEQVRAAMANPGASRGVRTGFVDIDRLIGGLEPTRLYVLAARPGMGKTSKALGIVSQIASAGHRVAVFSLEMGREQIVTQMIAQDARVEARKMLEGRGDAEDVRRWLDSSGRVAALPIVIDDAPGLSIGEIRSRARAMKRDGGLGLGLVVVDYLQLATCPDQRRGGREQEVSAVSRGLKGLAKDLCVPVLALAQLNRNLEGRADKRPQPSDLRESGSIEGDADAIMFIYRDEVYSPQSADKGLAEVIVAKNRGGPTGTVKLAFLAQYTLFQNYTRLDDDGPDRKTAASGGYW